MESTKSDPYLIEVKEKIIDPTATWISRLAKLPHGGTFAPPQMRYIHVSCENEVMDLDEIDEEMIYTPATHVNLVEYAFPASLFGGFEEAKGLFPSDEKHFSCITIQGIYVDENHRRKGVASFIINEIIKLAKTHGRHKLVCIESVITDSMHRLMNNKFPTAFKLSFVGNTYYIVV